MNKKGLLAGTAAVFLLLFCMACGAPASDKQALPDMGREKAVCETEEETVHVLSGDMAETVKMADRDKKAPKEEEESQGGHYTVTAEITVDNGRKLDLILHGFQTADWYGIDKGYTESWYENGGLDVGDMNLRDGANGRATEYYAYDENGKLQLVRYEYADYNEDVLTMSIYELIDGEMKLIGEEPLEPMVG